MTFVCILQNFKSKECIFQRLFEPTLKYQATVKLPCATVPVIFIKTKAENKGQKQASTAALNKATKGGSFNTFNYYC